MDDLQLCLVCCSDFYCFVIESSVHVDVSALAALFATQQQSLPSSQHPGVMTLVILTVIPTTRRYFQIIAFTFMCQGKGVGNRWIMKMFV